MNKKNTNSALDNLIPPEIKNDEFYVAIQDIVKNEEIKTILEIGSSSGEGSTEAFVTGIRQNTNNPILFCMEVSKTRFNELKNRYKNENFVKVYNTSSVPIESFPNEQEVIDFYKNTTNNLKLYPLESVLNWLYQDIEYVKECGYSENGIKTIKNENNIDYFDLVLIDGSEFTGSAELDEVYGAKYILLDDINTFKNHNNFHKLLKDHNYSIIKYNQEIRNGYAIFRRNNKIELPIHFFTIVLNGEPFIRYHIDIFKQLPFKWHWHIVEGVADLKHDTSWSVKLGGHISNDFHKNGRSCDGTTEYIDELLQLYPDNITVYRQPEGTFWDGKRNMVNAPLTNIQEECLLWQVDVDELWTLEQICTAREMFISNPDKTAAFYWCWYFVGENLIISTRNCYAHNPQQEWLRTWRFKPGCIWAAHEPPVLVEPLANGEYKNLATVNPFLHPETEAYNLVFQHFAYVTPEQLSFKEKYYGYKNAVERWSNLQENSKFPILLREYFPWVYDETQVDTVNHSGIVPIAQRDENDKSWRFLQPEEVQQQINKISKPSPMILIDGIFFQLYQTGIARVWKSLLEEWSNKEFAKHILFIDRAGTAPKVSGIKYLNLPRYNYKDTNHERELLQQVCDQEGVDLFISSYYTTPITTPSVFMAYDMIPEVMKWDVSNPMWQDKHQAIEHASAYIAISKNTAFDLTQCFNQISLESVILAYCGVSSTFAPSTLDDISLFKTKYGITKPYFLLPGVGSGYKNSILFFQAFSELVSSYGFDIVVTGGGGGLDAQFRNYTFGSVVHSLQLSDEELAIAYSGAVALVYPSKYEGFGMPVIEAMACGCPVITCPNASIPEVAGEAAIYVKDDDIDELANALCEVQKPAIRQSLITAGLAQAQKFSWSTMAEIVSSTLINTTLLSLNLREINLIIFPDWSESEDLIGLELTQIIKTLATHPDSDKTTLLIDTTNFLTEDAELLLSSATMNLLMEEDLDITDGIEISLVANLSDIQWEALLPRIHGRITLEHENQEALKQVKAENLTSYELTSFSQVCEEEFFFT
ncbi:Glycosyl transferase, group 1 [Trichormus variabilis ATCC 29413]|uniref:Glycosyl transferase, group 1 n=2 Tax=Anabaena variabilis TaxID=264691 RepID=Q3MGB1_TRIV2|nr:MULTISPECIES: glycosyltransferase family 1 protein [Nostocaceae]ABA19975.1 Glycosyl transferase, group 1 [Trichormus variabilis ATCC 29413]MBC1327256.1 glycosyltransferase family 4 protein [Trichormus variabilis 9RC]MBD2382295.1 glycosyltransferase family 4 protein [Trichormus variabilis FACHB-319]QFZ12839.1 glycosyltransferase family 1 protein [Anabaena sp. YBS01]QHD79518.1 glycosyltransferase [Trichormus variabilis 0441]